MCLAQREPIHDKRFRYKNLKPGVKAADKFGEMDAKAQIADELGMCSRCGSRYIQRMVIQKFSEKQGLDAGARPFVLDQRQGRLRQFIKMAEHRKRQMLEKMLME